MRSSAVGIFTALILAGCVTEKPNAFPKFDADHTITLSAGQSVILARGQKAKVPAGSIAVQAGPGNNQVNIRGQKNTLNFEASVVIVTVSTDASGPADNLVIVR